LPALCLQVVLAPIIVGMLANKYMNKTVKAVLPFSPVVGMVSTCLLVAAAVGQCSTAILNAGTHNTRLLLSCEIQ
jgi:BASS family bile acid:Na+ symporter